jgi:hypothetical protein
MAQTATYGKLLPFPTRVHVSYSTLQGGDDGIARSIRYMRALALGHDGALNPLVRQAAIEIVRGQPARDDAAQASAIFWWVKNHVEFRGESDEVLQAPILTLKFRAGDCDDHATLIAALLRALGIRARFNTVAADPTAPQEFTHVFTEAWIRRQNAWMALDTTVLQAKPGWRPEAVSRSKSWGTMGAIGIEPADKQNVAPGRQPEVSQRAQDISAVVSTIASGTRDVITAVRPNGAAGFDVRKTQGGYAGNFGVGGISPTTIALGSIGGVALLGMFLRRRG